jgi:hypothetical protein
MLTPERSGECRAHPFELEHGDHPKQRQQLAGSIEAFHALAFLGEGEGISRGAARPGQVRVGRGAANVSDS